MSQRLEEFREHAQGARIGAVQELFVQVGDRTPVAVIGSWYRLVVHFFSNSSTLRFNSRSVLSNSGSLGNAVTARSHSLAAKAGEPEMRAPASTSPPMPLWA